MKLVPRYDGPSILVIDDEATCQLVPVTRQRHRFELLLAELTAEQWGHGSRCEGWTTRDVVAHLVTVNEFWTASVVAGARGEATRILVNFDPAATPPLLVSTMSALEPTEVFDRFVSTNASLLETLAALSSEEWERVAESPVGHLPIRLLAQHALWDSWIHERDVVLPLGLTPVLEPDEVRSSLQYAAALSPVMALGFDRAEPSRLGVDATGPATQFVLEVGANVTLRRDEFDPDIPCLSGDAVELTEALSLRRPMSDTAPAEWRRVLSGLQAAFDAPDVTRP